MASDYYLFNLLHGLAGRWLLFDFWAVFFAEYLPYVAGAGFVIFCIFLKRPHKEKFFMLATSFIAAIIARVFVAEAIKLFVMRLRPFEFFGFEPLLYAGGPSFPSGHAMFWFAFSTALFGFNKKLGWIFFTLSTAVCIFRVIAGVHFPSDILVGAVMGILIGFLIHRLGVVFFDKSARLWI